jgi:recombination protein RecT
VPTTFAKYLTPERVAKIVMASVSRNPILLQCTQSSIIKSVAELVSIGLEPGGPLQQAYLVPRKNKKLNYAWECHPLPSYRGLITLLRRSGEFASVSANAVYDKDTFDIDLAAEQITHKPMMKGPRGDIVAVYAIARFAGGGMHMDFMTVADVDRVRERSPSKDGGPWVTDYDEMARKTVTRRASKYWPMSTEDLSKLQTIEARDADDDDAVSLEIFDADELPDVIDGGELGEHGAGETQPQKQEALPPANTAGKRILKQMTQQPKQPDWDALEAKTRAEKAEYFGEEPVSHE